MSEAQQAELLARQCRLYNRRGIGVVRDPGLMPGEVAVYQAVADRGELTTRTRLMFWVLPQATVADTLAYVDALPAPGSVSVDSVRGDGGGLGIWGLKLGMDGGVEGGFLCEPYANNPAFRGHAFWEPDDFEQVVKHAVGRGWRVGRVGMTSFAALLRAGGPAQTDPARTCRSGLWLTFLSPFGLEVAAAGGGAEWIGIDVQHRDLDLIDVAPLARVSPVPVLVRLGSDDEAQLARVLDAGVDGVSWRWLRAGARWPGRRAWRACRRPGRRGRR